MLITIGLAFGLALVTALLEVWLKLISRPSANGRRVSLERTDFVFWEDWVVTGTVALALLLCTASVKGQPIPVGPVMMALASLLFGYSVLPFLMRLLVYDELGKVKTWSSVMLADLVGALILLAAVMGGADMVT